MNKLILNSVPKSGTHVLVKVFDLLGYKDSCKHLSGSLVRPGNIFGVRNFFRKMLLISDLMDKDRLKVDLDYPDRSIGVKRFSSYIRDIQPLSYTESHLPYSKDMEEFLVRKGFKVAHIIRDPRSLVASYINHVMRDPNYPYHNKIKSLKTIRARVEFILNGDNCKPFILSPLADRLNNAYGWVDSFLSNVCVVRFEDLIGPNGGGDRESQVNAIRKIIRFLEIDLSEVEISRVADRVFDRKSETFYRGHIDGLSGFDIETKEFINKELSEWVEKYGYKNK